jgi:ribonuclease BN (tRNA processing enzyme)
MLASAAARQRAVIANETVIERYRVLSPYHFRDVPTHTIAPMGGGTDYPSTVSLGGTTIQATPTKHVEEAGREHSGIGFLISSDSDALWYSGDTTMFAGLIEELGLHRDRGAVVAVANADASDIARRPGTAERCHLLTRDIPTLCRALEPRAFVIHHYDQAYAGVRYRAAQAMYAQRCIDRENLKTDVLFAGDGLRLGFEKGVLVAAHSSLDAKDGDQAAAYAHWRSGAPGLA